MEQLTEPGRAARSKYQREAKEKLTDEAREKRREYQREWRKRNPDKVKANTIRFWNRQGEKLKLASEG